MSWRSLLKIAMEGSRKTFDNYERAKRLARTWSFAEPHVIREKNGKFTVMMKKDTKGFPEADFGPVVHEQKARFSR